jgi:hypothetical protein
MNPFHIIGIFTTWLIFWLCAYNGTVGHNFLMLGSMAYLVIHCREYHIRAKSRRVIQENKEIEDITRIERELEEEYDQENDPGKLFKLKEDLKMLSDYRVTLRIENQDNKRVGI